MTVDMILADLGNRIVQLEKRISDMELAQYAAQAVPVLTLPPPDWTPEEPVDAFDEFWALYPRRPRDGKANARKAFNKAHGLSVLKGLKAWLDVGAFNDNPKYIQHASTWLNQKCFLDTPEPYAGWKKPQVGNRTRSALADWLDEADELTNGS